MRPDRKQIVLIVDDEESIRQLSRLILERAGYGVLLASSGQEALMMSRGYSEHIHLLLSDVEMPGMNGIALGRQITAERSGIVVLLNSGNPFYAEETQFSFLAKPFSPAKLRIAIARTLESQPQALAHVELEGISPLVMAVSCPRPGISIPAMQSVETGAACVRQEIPSAIAEDQVGQRSGKVLPEPERRLPEAVVSIHGDRRNSPKLYFSTIRTGARNLAIAVRDRKSRRRLRHAVPIWVPAAAALVLAIAPFSLHRINEGLSAKPYPVSLQGVRGVAVEAEAPPGKLLHLNLDLTSLPQSDTYKIQIVNGDGGSLWQKVVPAQGAEVSTNTAAFRPGVYFVRVYGTSGDLLKEYELRLTETR